MLSASLAAESPKEAHHHAHPAPHGGALVELGEELAHVELLRARPEGRVTAWILDGEAERGVPIAQAEIVIALRVPGAAPVKLTLRAVENALSGERVGATSQFTASHPRLTHPGALDGEIERLEVKGRVFEHVNVRVE